MNKKVRIHGILGKNNAQYFIYCQANEDRDGNSENEMVDPVAFTRLIIAVKDDDDIPSYGKEQV